MATPSISPAVRTRASLTVRMALALIGFSAIVAQIVLMRELMVVFCGNEMTAGLMLASWLLWTAFGSGVLGRLRMRQPRRWVAGLEILTALVLPATVFAVRASRMLFHALPGEVLGPGATLLTSVLTLSVFCVLSGWLFAAGVRLYALEPGSHHGAAAGGVYLLEAIGSAAGGLVVTLLLAPKLPTFAIVLTVATLNLITAALLLARTRTQRWISAMFVAAGVGVLAPSAITVLERESLKSSWHGMQVLESRNSKYGNLVVVQNEGSRTVFENGLPLFTVPDAAAAEETVHYALLQHPTPRRLLLIGGGVNGSVREALKHPSLEQVDYVELDPELFHLAEQFFSREWRSMTADQRVHIIPGDGRRFLKNSPERWDVIVVNLPEPQTAQLNRFYTHEFFREAQAKLNAGGLLSVQLRSSENYFSPERADLLRCIYQTLHEVFAEVGFIPGETVHFFAGERNAIPNTGELMARLRQRGIGASYVREYFVPFRMMPDRMAEMQQVLSSSSGGVINRDFAPVAYYFGVVLWRTQFTQGYRSVFAASAQVGFGQLMAVIVIAMTLITAGSWMWRGTHGRGRNRTTAGLCVATMGFTLIGLEVLLLLGFQAIYGYVYHQLALLVATFMVGMAVGTWLSLRLQLGERALLWSQMAAVAMPGLLYQTLQILARTAHLGNQWQQDYLGEAVFVAMAALAGAMGGLQFAAASRTLASVEGPSPGESTHSGTLYALDLGGACVGALIITAYLLPVFGFARAAAVMAVVAAGPAVLAMAVTRRTTVCRK
jgi:spermidine synthase